MNMASYWQFFQPQQSGAFLRLVVPSALEHQPLRGARTQVAGAVDPCLGALLRVQAQGSALMCGLAGTVSWGSGGPCIHVYSHIYIYLYVYTYMYIYICTLYVCTHLTEHVYAYACACIYMYTVCVYICFLYLCTCMHVSLW